MPAEVKWAPCVTGLCLWHEADEHGEAGYRCVATMDEGEAGQYAEILNSIVLDYDHDRAAYRIAHGWVTPTREAVEDAVLRSIGHYPLEPRPGDVVTNGAVIADFKVRAVEIPPRASISDDEMTRLDRLKPNAAGAQLRKLLDDLAAACRRYDEIRSTGRKSFDPNYPPSLPSGHQNLLQSLDLMTNQISWSKAQIGALLQLKPFLAGDLTMADRDLLTVPDADEDDEVEEVSSRCTVTLRLKDGAVVGADMDDQDAMVALVERVAEQEFGKVRQETDDEKSSRIIAEHDRRVMRQAEEGVRAALDATSAEPSELDFHVPMTGKALGVIVKAAAAKPQRGEPHRPIHSVGVGQKSICATDQFKIIIVGEPEDSYESTKRIEALVEASACDIRCEFVHWSQVARMEPEREGEDPPEFPDVAKVVKGLDDMVDVGAFDPTLLKQVAAVAESLGAFEVRLFRSAKEQAMLGFKGFYHPMSQLDLFCQVTEVVHFKGLLCGRKEQLKDGPDGGEADD